MCLTEVVQNLWLTIITKGSECFIKLSRPFSLFLCSFQITKEEHAQKAFRKCRLFPWNAEAIDYSRLAVRDGELDPTTFSANLLEVAILQLHHILTPTDKHTMMCPVVIVKSLWIKPSIAGNCHCIKFFNQMSFLYYYYLQENEVRETPMTLDTSSVSLIGATPTSANQAPPRPRKLVIELPSNIEEGVRISEVLMHKRTSSTGNMAPLRSLDVSGLPEVCKVWYNYLNTAQKINRSLFFWCNVQR
jgi:hypothetical protein